MRQKCEFCHTNPELNDRGICPNCGAAMPILMNVGITGLGSMSTGDVKELHYPRPSGSAHNPTTGIPSG